MKKLLDSRPDIQKFLEIQNIDAGKLKLLGIDVGSLTTLKDLSDLQMVLAAVGGDKSAKSYVDEQYDRETALEAMNTPISV
jgi:hypothetical protein